MQRFKYRIRNAAGDFREAWVCEPCKKENGDNILLGKWKLIARHEGNDIRCTICDDLTAEDAETQREATPSSP